MSNEVSSDVIVEQQTVIGGGRTESGNPEIHLRLDNGCVVKFERQERGKVAMYIGVFDRDTSKEYSLSKKLRGKMVDKVLKDGYAKKVVDSNGEVLGRYEVKDLE